MRKYFSFWVITALLSSYLQAQTDPNALIVRDSRVINPIPPTPEMASLGKFGDIAFEKSQGVASHSIPIYTITYDGVSIPLQLQYSSSGFRPSDPGSYLGLHWMLNGVGGISREIKGQSDENGYLINSVNQAYIDQARLDANDTYAGQSLVAQFNSGIDISQDGYTVSTTDITGRFFINAQKQFDFSVKTDNKLTYTLTTGPISNSIKFWITDVKGNKYEFSEEERTFITSQNGYSRTSVSQDGITSWKLSKITTASGKEILFSYTQYNFSYNNPSQDVFTGKSSAINPPDETIYCGCSQETNWKYGTNGYYFQSKLLTSITTANETVEFTYTDDVSASYYQKKLTAIQVKDFNGTVKKKFDFSFGYYNGGNRLKLTEFKASDPSDASNIVKYGFNYYEDYTTPDIMSRSIDAYKFFNGASNTHLIVSSEAEFPGPSADRSVRPLYAQQTLLKELVYPTKGKTKFVYEANGDVASNNLGAGLRLKELINYNDNVITDRRVFVYRQYQGPRLLLNNIPYNVYTESSNPSASWCSRIVLTSDNQYGEIQNTIPVPTDFYYKEVDELVKGAVNDIKSTFKYAAQDSMMVGDQQIRPTQELQYKFEGGSYVLLKEKILEYETTGITAYPNRVFQYAVLPAVLDTYVAFSDYSGWCSLIYFSGGIAQSYPRYRSIIRLKKITNKDYQGSNYLQTVTELAYGNSHELPRYVKITDSKGVAIEKAILYPTEASVVVNPALTPSQVNIFNAMVTKNMLEFVIAEEVRRGPSVPSPGTNVIDGARTIYSLFNNAYYLPDELYDRQKDGTYYRVHKFLGYDANGNLLSSQKEADAVTSYIWDFKGIYLIAQATNTLQKDIFHTSFEDSDGNSTIGDCKAGKKSRTGGYTKSLTGLTNGSYVLSYWQKSGNNWTLQSSAVTVSAGSYTISLSGQVDEVRFHPAAAKMITYTYDPLIGMISQTDVKNQYSYYEYDGLGRLVLIRDEDKNILKKFCYNYNGQPETCPYVASSQWQSTGLTRCQPCPGNPAYTTNIQEHQEKDMNPSSPTYNTFRWVSDGVSSSCIPAADWQNTTSTLRCQLSGGVNTGYQEQEQRDMNPCSSTYNQTRWIQASYNTTACPPYVCNTSNCSGNDKKCINNVCQTGTLVCVSSVKINKTTWQCTWKYCFSDGSLSTYSTTTNSTTDCLVLICGN